MIFAVKGVDGVYIEADNFTEIMYGVMSLTKQNAEVADWMEGIARRCALDSGVNIRMDNHRNFITDLINHGYLTAQEIH